ncbi:uncharacterized protein ARMOST_19768 [Armillaria ostoyae]|uniref:Uncharacterized protein n=1 Tax=Armillaria ostoyae TaxID=47428 RepID=A0A284S5G0_ARMOS|nr:uncharacterized protein ARMOST_19768 [Armillaria ostoyae]
MTRSSNLETWIDIAKLGVAAGELAPFPYIKGLCGCAVLVLEAIEKAGKNNEDLLDLADSIGKTIEMVQNTVTEHGESSALRFRDVCAELEVFLTDLISELNSTRRKSRGIKRFLKAKSVSDAINGYQERVREIKGDFLIHTAIDSRFDISDIKDGLRTNKDALATAIETSQRKTMSNINKHADNICDEISTWGVLQSKKADKLSADVQTLKERGFYKGFIRDVLPEDVYLKEPLASVNYPDRFARPAEYKLHNAEVENSNTPKIVRIYHSHNKEKDVMKQFYIDVDGLINLKHPNIAQVFGICRSPDFPAIILHGTTQHLAYDYWKSLTAIQLLQVYSQLFNDLESASDYLNRLYYNESFQSWSSYAFDEVLNSMYINEQDRIVFAELAESYYVGRFFIDITRDNKKVQFCDRPDQAPDISDLIMHHSVPDISQYYNPQYCHYSPGSLSTRIKSLNNGSLCEDSLVVGQIPVELTGLQWDVRALLDDINGGYSRPLSLCSGSVTIHHDDLSIIPKHYLIRPSVAWLMKDYTQARQTIYSLFAQASQLSLSSSQNLESIDHKVHNIQDIEVCHFVSFRLEIMSYYDPFQLLNTFMADSDYAFALSLTVCKPHLDLQSNKFLPPVIHWFCDPNLSIEISVKEVEVLFGIKVSLEARADLSTILKKPLSTIVEINTKCGFDPALKGADICEYFSLSHIKIFENPVEVCAGK